MANDAVTIAKSTAICSDHMTVVADTIGARWVEPFANPALERE